MHDPLEQTFDRWLAAQAGGVGLRVGLSAWAGVTTTSAASGTSGGAAGASGGGGALGAVPTATLHLPKAQVFADRYVRGVLEDRRLTVPLRFGYAPATQTQTPPHEGVAWWREASGDRAMSVDELATLGVLAVREAFHAERLPRADDAFIGFSGWLLTALDLDAGTLSMAMRRAEPRVFWWWGRALEHRGERAAAMRAWTWQTGAAEDQGPTDVAVQALLKLAEAPDAPPADRLGYCKRAQRLLDQGVFRDFDLQTHLDVARAAALLELRYRAEAADQLRHVEQRLIANPCAGAARQAARVALLSRRAGGLGSTLRLLAGGAIGVSRSATARFKLRRAYDLRRWRPRHPRLPLDVTIGPPHGAAIPHGDARAQAPQRIALLRLDRLGDLVTMQPVVQQLRQRFPEAAIDLYVTAGLEGLAQALAPGVHAVGVDWKDAATFARHLEGVRNAEPYNLTIDLLEPDASRQARLLRALPVTPGGAKVGFDSPGRREHCTHRVPPPSRPMHLIDRTALLLRPLGVAVPDDAGWSPRLGVSGAARAEGEVLLRAAVGEGPWLGVHVGAGWKFKRWYPEAFGRVCRQMRERHGCKVAVLAGPTEQAIAQRVVEGVGHEQAAVLTPSLTQLPGVTAACRLMLVNDSGPMHVATAVGVPTVVAWGPGDRTLFAPRPWNPASPCVVVADQPRCANCPQEVDSPRCPMGYRYEDVPCLRGVSEAGVLSACEALWTATQGAHKEAHVQ